MIRRICCYHKPNPIVIETIDDGQPGVLRTDGLCPECLAREEAARAGRSNAPDSPPTYPGSRAAQAGGAVSASFPAPPPLPTWD